MKKLNTTPGPYEAEILADSIADGVRLTTIVTTMPRIVLAEFNTHRVFSRNSASSRAIPVKKKIKMVKDNPFVPLSFGKNQRGMSASEDLEGCEQERAEEIWLAAKDEAVEFAKELSDIGVHKQLANRLLEPFAWQTILFTTTEIDNYLALRVSEDAQPEIHRASANIKKALDASIPTKKLPGDWHLPLVFEEDIEESYNYTLEGTHKPGAHSTPMRNSRKLLPDERDLFLVKLSCARCARVSYLTHDGKRSLDKDFELYDRLASHGHMSPLEHAAMVGVGHGCHGFDDEFLHHQGRFDSKFIGNFRAPWIQHRKMIPGEDVFRG